MPKKDNCPKSAKISNRYFLSVTDIVNKGQKGRTAEMAQNFKPPQYQELLIRCKKAELPKCKKISNRYFLSVTDIVKNSQKARTVEMYKNCKKDNCPKCIKISNRYIL